MMLPNAERAAVDAAKLRAYCLNPHHDEGKHKARLFAAALGMSAADAQALRGLLLEGIKVHEATLGLRDEYGQRYRVDLPLEWQGRRAVVRSGWIIEYGAQIPRLTTCYPL